MTPPNAHSARRATFLGLLAGVALVAVGCGPSTTAVSGTVKYRSKPLPGGTVTLVDASGTVHQADIESNGQYSLPKVQVGDVRIAVSVPKTPKNKPAPFGEKQPKQPAPQVQLPDVPIEYASPDTSGLTGTVTRGQPLDVYFPK